MKDIHALQKRIDKMLAAIEQQIPVQSSEPLFEKMHLFTKQEQSRLQTFLLLNNISHHRFRERLSELDPATFTELGHWLHLEQALDGEDITAAEQYRRVLAPGYQEQLLQRFMTLDENRIPDFDLAPEYTDKRGIRHKLYRTQFRSDRASIKRQLEHGLRPGEIETMRMWVDTFSPGPGPIVA